ncbi:Clavaminate synthase-like protein [Aspergillus sclerotioniger CBS 115572]|uniref:Clavaminate synthase-like protein n=1 Tax=Aspergillus sclerotioniger CBS 115572 TaxID=1450535 RepID=A0A317V3X4_9EURO|nr:Clavaminate synthase-like protein [Aspergillus sclerotioniger CBS 115572]PWY68973.1 Clavaminate synthase-like protein [Aspergillus sclerotioniger CBS 115572]
MGLATLSFDLSVRGSRAQRHAASTSLVNSLRSTGFVKLTNHGMPLETIQQAQEWEDFDFGPPDNTKYPNSWPNNIVPGFRGFTETFHSQCQKLCLDVMSACELGCDVPKDTFLNRCVPAASELRYNYYPSSRRGWPHTDFGTITLLFQDTKGGLEYEDRRNPGTFIPLVREKPDEIAINVSDTFQRWTNDSIPALQRAGGCVLPQRHSTAFFLKAHRECMVGAIPEFMNEQRPSSYDDITALEYHNRRTQVLVKASSAPTAAGALSNKLGCVGCL